MIIKFNNLINFLGFLIIDFLLKKKRITSPNSILLIRLDAIGDYVLFRNFIKILKESIKYKNYKITLCGNILWKDLAENFDADVVDNFIWIDRQRFYGNLFYKYKMLKKIRDYGFEVAIETTYSREILYGDEIIKISRAKTRIGSKGIDDKHSKWKRALFSDKWYTKLIAKKSDIVFEFNVNKEFFEELLQTKVNIKKPFINTSNVSSGLIIAKPYVVIFHGSARKEKNWDYKKFIEVADYIIKHHTLNIILVGGKNEIDNSVKILKSLSEKRVLNLTGKTSLTELTKIIASSEFLISNDSAAVHLSASIGKEFICISNGERYGRFLPYPKEIFDKGYYVYPDEIKNSSKFFKELSEIYRFDSNLDINSISSEEVISLCDKILNSI